MPTFDYICQKCQKVTEFILMAADPRPTKCPECDGKLHKCLSAPAIQFKGSGWYVTDYAKRPTDAAASKANTPAEGAPAAAGEKKDASTPAAPANESSKETAKETSAPKKDAAPAKKEN